ncbi:hypothetical protein N9W34_03040 [Rickettsiales bacterium]|nr:hypothetical protein [Rickettsiales bacterium]
MLNFFIGEYASVSTAIESQHTSVLRIRNQNRENNALLGLLSSNSSFNLGAYSSGSSASLSMSNMQVAEIFIGNFTQNNENDNIEETQIYGSFSRDINKNSRAYLSDEEFNNMSYKVPPAIAFKNKARL